MTQYYFGYYATENDGFGGYYDESEITDMQAEIEDEITSLYKKIDRLEKAKYDICSTMLKCEVDAILEEAFDD